MHLVYMSKEFRYFTLYKLNNKIIQFGRVKISSESGKPLDAAKKLLSSICEYEGLTKNNKLKCKAHFYIRETTRQSKKQIFGPYKGSFKKYDKPVSIKLKNGNEIKHKMYTDVVKVKDKKIIIQKGGKEAINTLKLNKDYETPYDSPCGITGVIGLSEGNILAINNSRTMIMWEETKIHSKETKIPIDCSEGNAASVNCVSKNAIASKSKRIWKHKYLEGHTDIVNCAIILSDGKIVSGSDDGTLLVWNKDGFPIKQLMLPVRPGGEINQDNIMRLFELSNDCFASGSFNGRLLIWSMSNNYKISDYLSYPRGTQITCMIKLSDGNIVSGFNDGTLIIWQKKDWNHGYEKYRQYNININNWQEKGFINEDEKHNNFGIDENYVTCVIQLLNGNIVIGCNNGNLIIFNTYETNISILEGHTKSVNCLIKLSDGNFVSGSDDNTLKIWNKDDGTCIHILNEHTGGVTCVIQLFNGNIVSGSKDNTLKIWNKDNGSCIDTLNGHIGDVTCVIEL